MDTRQRDLYSRIEAFQIDEPGAEFPFAVRLARENAWDRRYAQRVVGEYKRFVLLMAAAGHPVTPSDQVDQAWHLHLTYTRSYWDRLCGQVIGGPLHHDPTEGGRAEDAKFDDWYQRTLETYRRLFGENPPADIWPDSQTRFGVDPRCIRVNKERNWVIPKRALGRVGVLVGSAAAALALMAGGGVMMAAGGGANSTLGFVVMSVVIVAAIGAVIRAAMRHSARADKSFGCGAGCGMGASQSHTDTGDSGSGDSGCGSGCGGGGCGGGGN